MKKKFKIAAIALITAAAASITSVGVLSWFENRVDVGLNDKITGIANGAYFADGDGSSEHPFIINTPRHMYNLAWLQYLGYFNNNLVGPETGPVYFALDPAMTEPLNMAGLTIPPIGTTTFPFLGYFNGNNKTILNLKVDNVVDKTSNDHINKTPSAIKEAQAVISGGNNDKVLRESIGGPTNFSNTKVVNVMGMFGQTDTLSSGDTAKHIYDFTLDSATISSSSKQLLVGVAAGYLDSKMSNVTVKTPSINLNNNPVYYDDSLTTDLSKYTLVGYATSSFVTEAQEKKTIVQTPIVTYEQTAPTSGSEYGASIPMKNVYEHLLNVHNSSEPFKYNKVWNGNVGDENNYTKDPIYEGSGNGRYGFFGNKEKDGSNNEIASYTFAKRPGVDAYMYLYGEASGTYTQTSEGVVNTASSTVPFSIGNADGTHWLTYNGSKTDTGNNDPYPVYDTTDVSSATKWLYDGGAIRSAEATSTETNMWGQITAYHYAFLVLDANNQLRVRVGEQMATKFDWQTSTITSEETQTEVELEDGTTQIVVTPGKTFNTFMTGVQLDNGVAGSAYLRFANNSWGVTIQDAVFRYFKLGDKYLHADPNQGSITLANSESEATKWYPGTGGGWMVKSETDGLWYTLGITIESFQYAVDTLFGGKRYHTAYRVTGNLVFATDSSTLAARYNEVAADGEEFYLKTNINIATSWNWGPLSDSAVYTDYYFYLTQNGASVKAVTQEKTDKPSAGSTFIELGARHDPAFDLSFKTSSISTPNTPWASYPTYFPLSYTDDGSDVSSKNTGYIVSGSNYIPTNGNFPGDIRVSNYTNGTGNRNQLANSLGGTGYDYAGRMTVITHEKGASGRYVALKDDYNTSVTAIPATLNGYASALVNATSQANDLGLVRYMDARAQLHAQFNAAGGFSNIHGLHFMDAQISKDRLTTVPKATIMGQTYTNYPMPQDCIDFNLKKNGFITFFAGTYFPGNTTFFSLHQIIRSGTSIVDTKEISAIFDNVGENRRNKRYIYDYSGGSSNLDASAGDEKGDKLFDMSWVTNPTMVEKAVYYFEIPINSGEYALGSVSGKDGAYLMYLDIGTSQRVQDITTIEEDVLTESKTSSYVGGVDFGDANSGTTGDGGNSANITIPAGSTGTLSYIFNSNTSTLTCTGTTGASASHVGEGVTLSGATDGRVSGDSVHVETTTTITYDDFDETITTTTSKKTTINNGTPSTTDNSEVEYNILPDEYETLVEIAEQDNEALLIRFRYWGSSTVNTRLERLGNVYTIYFDTTEELEVFIEYFSVEESDVPYTVILKGNNDTAGVTAVSGQYVTINSGS